MTKSFQFTLIWLTGSLIAILMALNSIPASLVDGHYIPVSNDSFYHARRILDTAANPAGFYEFDQKIHVPEGSQLTWPWGYDYVMALVVRAVVSTGLVNDPMTALAYLPVAATTISIALIVGITLALRLSASAALLATLCAALSALAQSLHGVGVVDHHFAEYIFALAALLTGLSWMNSLESRTRALIAGAVLGLAPAFQNGLFILQLPLLVAIGVLWLRNIRLPRTSAIAFGGALAVTTLLALIPSAPFRQGQFEFYLLSWFHLYVAVCTAAVVIFMASFESGKKALLGLMAFAAVAFAPMLHQAIMGGDFVTGRLEALPMIVEARSIVALARDPGLIRISEYYSALIFFVPISLVGCIVYLLKSDLRPQLTFFSISCVIGSVLMLMQFRLHVLGSFALFLPLILVVDNYATNHQKQRLVAMCALTVALAVAYIPPIRGVLFEKQNAGRDMYYSLTRGIFPALADACNHHPGVVLASSDNGHYIRFHTNCSVISNNFLLTPQHTAKFREVRRFMAMTPDELLESGITARYVLVTLGDIASEHPDSDVVAGAPERPREVRPTLVAVLLFSQLETINPRYRLIKELRFKDSVAFARVFEILPDQDHGR